jgi:hypothetical protein
MLSAADIILGSQLPTSASEDPYEGFLEKKAARKGVSKAELAAKDLDLWNKWKHGGEKPDDLRPLLKNARGLIRKESNAWASRANLPPAAVRAEFTRWYVEALKTYDPTRGAQVGSWGVSKMRAARRWVATRQDPTRIQEGRYYKLGEWDNKFASLSDQLGRDPNTREMAEAMGWSEAEAGRMEMEKRKTLYSSGFEGGYDPTNVMPSEAGEKLRLYRYELSGRDLDVFDYTVGMFGKPKLKPSQIAKKLGVSPSTITRIRQKIAKGLESY